MWAHITFPCRLTHGRLFHVRGPPFRLPSFPLGALQLTLAATNWATMGLLLFVLMPPGLPYTDVLGALLLAAIASAVAHIPAGIGVLEAVFLALLGYRMPAPQLLAALLAYRACYYLGPLLVAIAGYAWLEANGRPGPGRADAGVPGVATLPIVREHSVTITGLSSQNFPNRMHGGCRVATEVKSRRASATRKVPETTRGNAPAKAPAQAPAKKTASKPATT